MIIHRCDSNGQNKNWATVVRTHPCRERRGTRHNQHCRGSRLCTPGPARRRGRISAESLLHGERLAHGRFRIGVGGLGAGVSDPGPMPRTSVRIAEELRTALHNAGIAGPYILVGSAFGGDNVRTFADLYVDEVAGLVMVDADADDVGPKEMQQAAHRAHAEIPSDLRDCRDAIPKHKPQQTCAQQFFFRGLPEAEWSPELNAKVLEIAQAKVAMYDAFASEMEQTPADETWLQRHVRSFGSRPIRVLPSGNHGVGHLERKPPDTPEHLKYEQETTAAQARWLALSSNAKQIFTHNSSEYIQFDEPETLIKAVREVYDRAMTHRRRHGK